MSSEKTHPDETELLDFVACGRLPFVRDAAKHEPGCGLCARTVDDLLRIAQAMFESEPEEAVSASTRREAFESARDDDRSRVQRGKVRLRRSTRARARA